MANVGTELGRISDAHLRVEVGAVHVNLTAMQVNDGADLLIASSNTPCVDG